MLAPAALPWQFHGEIATSCSCLGSNWTQPNYSISKWSFQLDCSQKVAKRRQLLQSMSFFICLAIELVGPNWPDPMPMPMPIPIPISISIPNTNPLHCGIKCYDHIRFLLFKYIYIYMNLFIYMYIFVCSAPKSMKRVAEPWKLQCRGHTQAEWCAAAVLLLAAN